MTSPPLRILQVNSGFAGGGIDNQTFELAAGLHELGQKVILGIPAGQILQGLAEKAGLRTVFFREISPLHNVTIRAWRRLIRVERIDIIHAHKGNDYWPAILAARLAFRGTKVVITRHIMGRPSMATRLLILSQAHMVAVSKAVEEGLREDLVGSAGRIHRIYGGVDTRTFTPARTETAEAIRKQYNWPTDAVVFGVVGRYSLPEGKGQKEFLNAAARIKDEFPQARFAMIGKGRMEPLLREQIALLELSKVAVIIPFMLEMAPMMQALDVLVHPTTEREALGVVFWEAMACGKPVIGSKLDGIPEAFLEGVHGFLVPPRDVAGLAEAMRAILRSPETRHQFGGAGREYVARDFSREAYATRMLQLYRNILKM
ncbi:MAG TPA: glycosyltransferase family 4 protein [Verrucomicrobiae bacterium]|nr:glycosyltransferase family 4 protein [Verrucomicrobiae bacterium]